jgi:hypothetical protein
MAMQFAFWSSRAWGFLADALARWESEQTHLEALSMPREPILSWSVYIANAPTKWLGTVEAGTAAAAIELAAEKFDEEPGRLMALRRA